MTLSLIGNRFICNIAQPENSPGGLFMVNRDPRKQRNPPDAYVGVVEEVGPACRFVEVGKKIVLRRWVYRQHDLDDERIIAYESQVLILGEDDVFPGICVMKVKSMNPTTSLIVPDMVEARTKHRMKSYEGIVLNSGIPGIRKDMHLWIEKRDRGQYFLNPGTFVFRDEPDSFNGDSPILAIGETIKTLQVV